jgi:phosphomannomutase
MLSVHLGQLIVPFFPPSLSSINDKGIVTGISFDPDGDRLFVAIKDRLSSGLLCYQRKTSGSLGEDLVP